MPPLSIRKIVPTFNKVFTRGPTPIASLRKVVPQQRPNETTDSYDFVSLKIPQMTETETETKISPSAAMQESLSPMEDTIRSKITAALNPTLLEIRNDSAHHAHHRAMASSTSKETHFNLTIISSAFTSKPQPARHRMVYALLKDELAQEGGIHALQLRTKTPEEEQKLKLQERSDSQHILL